MNTRDVLCDAILFFGTRTQIWKAIEELGELLAALGKSEVSARDRAELIDEIADASIMVEQLALIYGEADVRKRRQMKVERLAALVGHIPEETGGAEC